MTDRNHLAAEEHAAQSPNLGIHLLDLVIHVGPTAAAPLDGCMMEIPCRILLRSPISEVLNSLSAISQITVNLKSQLRQIGNRVGLVSRSERKGPKRLARLARLVGEYLQILVPLGAACVAYDRIMIEREQLQGHLPVETIDVFPVTVRLQCLARRIVREQIQIAIVRVIGRTDPRGPCAQFREVVGRRLVAQEIARRRRMIHETANGRLGLGFQLGARNDQPNADPLGRIQRAGHSLGIGILGKLMRESGILELFETFDRRTIGRNAVPCQNRHFARRG